MADFLEEVLYSTVKYGSSWQDEYNVNVVETSGGQEYRSLTHPFPKRTFTLDFELATADMWPNILDLYHRAHGTYAGFRAWCIDEDSSNGSTGTPTAFDQSMGLVSTGVYELRKYYGLSGTAGAAGYPYRKIKKPQSGTTLVGVGVTAIRSADWSVSTTTGLVTFNADQTKAVTNITKASQAVITLGSGHGLVANQSVHISTVSGMTQINGQRALITATDATTITVEINSTSYGTYTSGGVVHTRPQTGETVTAGFRFHFPVRFKTVLEIGQDYPIHRVADGVEFIELLNP
jgi:uncharacterized protein (TIGR02217 family)